MARFGIRRQRDLLLVHWALATNDLRDALMAHAHDPGDGRHRQALAVRGANRLVPLLLEGFLGLRQRSFALSVLLGESSQTASGLRGLAFRASDLKIV